MKASTVIRETQLPARWVHRVARRRAGKFKHGEDDPCLVEPCPWCEALRWVLLNAAQVRVDEEAEDTRARLKQAHKRVVASVQWKRENQDLFEFLESMVDGDFRNSALRAVDEGVVTPAMEAAVKDAARRRPTPPPMLGAGVDTIAHIDSTSDLVDRWGRRTLRVEFVAEAGWRGRVELHDLVQIRAWNGAKTGTPFTLQGRVSWRVDRMAVVTTTNAMRPVAQQGV